MRSLKTAFFTSIATVSLASLLFAEGEGVCYDAIEYVTACSDNTSGIACKPFDPCTPSVADCEKHGTGVDPCGSNCVTHQYITGDRIVTDANGNPDYDHTVSQGWTSSATPSCDANGDGDCGDADCINWITTHNLAYVLHWRQLTQEGCSAGNEFE